MNKKKYKLHQYICLLNYGSINNILLNKLKKMLLGKISPGSDLRF